MYLELPLPTFVHIGCGYAGRERVHGIFRDTKWHELRQDINPEVQPDLLCSMTDLSALSDASVYGLFSSHNLEHLHSFEVPLALTEFRRVLAQGGFAILTVPDIQALGRYLSEDRLDHVLYQSAVGPIKVMDVLFGHQNSIQDGNGFMAHKTAFTGRTLGQALLAAGFYEVKVIVDNGWNLWALASTTAITDDLMQAFCAELA